MVLGNPPYSGHSANRSWAMDQRAAGVDVHRRADPGLPACGRRAAGRDAIPSGFRTIT